MANAAEITMSIMRQKTRRKRELTFLAVAAIMVIACVVAWLRVDGVATTGEAMCGYEEHAHTAECYELVYNCGYEEGEVLSAEPDYAAIEADMRAAFEAEAAVRAIEQAEAQQLAEDAAAAEAEAAGEDPQAAREAAAALADPEPVVDGAALAEAVEAAYAEAEAAIETHTHTESCAEARLICELEEHTHVPLCYSNPSLDVETPDEWEATFADVELTGEWPADVLAIAETQVGYTESEQNFTLGEDSERRGYTRYGDWYDNPYGVWDGLFVMFCLEYAGVDTDYLPCQSGAYAWTADLQRASAYKPAAAYLPNPGDLVFFNTDYEDNDKADRVGIVKSINEDLDELVVIEGDLNNTVAETTYQLSSESIQGYCDVAERQAVAEDPSNGVIPIDKYGSLDDEFEGEGAVGEGEGTDAGIDEGEGSDEGSGAGDGDDAANTNTASDDPKGEQDDKADTNGDGADKNADKDTDPDKDTGKPGQNPEGTNDDDDKKADQEKPVIAEKPEGSAAPTPSGDPKPNNGKVVPLYAAFVNSDGEMMLFTESAQLANVADKKSTSSENATQSETTTPSEAATQPEMTTQHEAAAQPEAVAKPDATTSETDTTSDPETAPGKTESAKTDTVDNTPSSPEEDPGLKGIEEVNLDEKPEPLDFGDYFTGVTMEYQRASVDVKESGKEGFDKDIDEATTADIDESKSVDINEEDWAILTDDIVLQKDDKVRFTLEYELGSETLAESVRTLTTVVTGIDELDAQKGDILDELSHEKLGTYDVYSDGEITVAFNDATVRVNEGQALLGTVVFQTTAANLVVGEDSKGSLTFGQLEPVAVTVAQNTSTEDPEEGNEPGESLEPSKDEKDSQNTADKDIKAVDEGNFKGDSEYATFRFTKVDGDTGEPLNGAVFGLYGYNNEAETYERIGTVTSGKGFKDGEVTVSMLRYNTAYYLEEETAPEGYEPLMDPDTDMPQLIYFDIPRGSDDTVSEGSDNPPIDSKANPADFSTESTQAEGKAADGEGAYPKDFAFSSTLLEKQTDGAYILKNYRPKTSIGVKIAWQDDKDGIEKVKVHLHRIITNSETKETTFETEPYRTCELSKNSTSPWETVFENLPTQAGEETYTYCVTQDSSELYTLVGMTTAEDVNTPIASIKDGKIEMDMNGNPLITGITEGVIVITNKYNETGYELPSTGGCGVLPYYIGGGLLAAAAGVIAVAQRRRLCRQGERGMRF